MHKEMQTGCFLCHSCYLQLLYLGCLTHWLPSFVGGGGESLLVAKKSNSNQCKWELGAASCNPGQYVRLLQSSRNRAVNQSSGLASPQWKLGFLHWRWSSSLQRLQRLFLMWSTCLCHKLTYISMPKQCSNLSPCIAPQMAYLTLNT